MKAKNSDRIQFGPYEADLHTHELWKFGLRVKLVGQPFEVLAILLSKPGQLVTREELRDRLWPGDTYVDFNHGLNAAVNRLREALCDSADDPRYVETLPRRGYRFVAAIQQPDLQSKSAVPDLQASALASQQLQPSLPTVATSTPPAGTRGRALRWLLVGGCLAFVFVAAFALVVIKKVRSGTEAAVDPVPRIRPLTTLTDETNEPAFSPDGNFVAFRREGSIQGNSGIFVKGIVSDQLIQITKDAGDGYPVWSPDGRFLAFSRATNHNEGAIYVVAVSPAQAQLLSKTGPGATVTAGAGEERILDIAGAKLTRGEIDWSPDGKAVAFSSNSCIFLVSLDSHTTRQLTQPPPIAEDWGPSFSPDGQTLLFVRDNKGAEPEQILAVPTQGGDAMPVASDQAAILSPPRWSVDGKSVIFASARSSHTGLWRTTLNPHDSPVEINDGGSYPTISRKGYRMAYQRAARGLNIWQMDLTSPANQQHILVPSTSQTDQGPGPQFSPDARRLAYMSDRSGTMEIWVSDRDGSNPVQLTTLGFAGTPRWSPDSQSIAFDRRGAIYVVSTQGGAPRLLAPDNLDNDCPSWSADGKWVYFASTRTRQFQLWKTPSDGSGAAVQVTTQGGHSAMAAPDGKYIYYAKTQYADPEIWQVPVDGGAESQLSPLVRPATWASWAVVDRGIVFAGPSGKGRPVVSLFDFATRRVTGLGVLNIPPFWLGATRDGKTVVFDQPGTEQDQVMLMENFR